MTRRFFRPSSLRDFVVAPDTEGHRPRGKKWHVQTLARVVASVASC